MRSSPIGCCRPCVRRLAGSLSRTQRASPFQSPSHLPPARLCAPLVTAMCGCWRRATWRATDMPAMQPVGSGCWARAAPTSPEEGVGPTSELMANAPLDQVGTRAARGRNGGGGGRRSRESRGTGRGPGAAHAPPAAAPPLSQRCRKRLRPNALACPQATCCSKQVKRRTSGCNGCSEAGCLHSSNEESNAGHLCSACGASAVLQADTLSRAAGPCCAGGGYA